MLIAVATVGGAIPAGATIITNREQLAAIANDLDGTYVLEADIDLAGIDWTPIGDTDTPFAGTFDGQGHILSNLVVNTAGDDYAGLFGSLIGTVQGVTLVNPVVSGGAYVGALAGEIGEDAHVSRCGVVGASVTASGECSGAFAGQICGGADVSESFAAGTVSSAGNSAGGFAGYVEEAFISDCYAVADVSGKRYAGSFAGKIVGPEDDTAIERCYAAGTASGTQDAGGFAGALEDEPGLTDCFAQDPDAATDGVTALDAAEMRAAANFAAFHATGRWTQDDGRTQPYFAWGLVDGKFILSGDDAITGRGAYDPGTNVLISCNSQDRIFIGWTGTATYADRINDSTTVLLDNHRTVAAELGTIVTDRAGLAAVADNLAGTYVLAADIDLAGMDWTPIGFTNANFTGKFYGNGHTISNLVVTNNPSISGRGLFGVTVGATIDGVTVYGTVAGTAFFSGGLVGNAIGTHIVNCHADCSVSSSSSYTGGLVGGISEGTTIVGCSAGGTVHAEGQYTGGLVGYCGGDRLVLRDSFSTADVTGIESTGGFVGYLNSGGLEISGCRADGFTGGRGKVGGFVGSVSSNTVATISGCVARGDVRSFASSYGGFVGEMLSRTATNFNCWSSGAIWGTGGDIGAFAGKCTKGTNINCAVSGAANGPRYFCGSNIAITGAVLSAAEVVARSVDANGDPWPDAPKRAKSASMTPISTVEELFAVTNDLAGSYVLTADIDLNGQSFEPIGTGSKAFSGEFYGQNHKIIGFDMTTTNLYAGFFGNIHGGRVNGVRLEGTVSYQDNPNISAVCLGGFAGEIQSKSLVDDCAFMGEIQTEGTRYVGGFVGYTEDAPLILRCCVGDTRMWNASSSQQYTGGFVGCHNNGFIKDCCALVDVSADHDAGGFAGYVATSARIATSWCSGQVKQDGSWIGAFVGHANGKGIVTNCYYDSSVNGDLAAHGTGAIYGSENYNGITPVDDMSITNNLPALDFVETWKINEGDETPYLRAVFTAYELWLKDAGLEVQTEPDKLENGIPAVVRYVFGIDPALGPADLPEPLIDVKIDANGKPYVKLPPLVNTEGATVTVLATEDLSDWSDAKLVPMVYDASDGTYKPADGESLPRLFFKWAISFDW
jgi:hypothetical protein